MSDTPAMVAAGYRSIVDDLARLYAEDERPWLVGFSGGKDSTMVASLVFGTVLWRTPECSVEPAGRPLDQVFAPSKGTDFNHDLKCRPPSHS